MNNTYTLSVPLNLAAHYRQAVRLFGDHATQSRPDLDASVRSGDYFITLATMLEAIAADLPELSIVTNSQALARLADDLYYIQRHYTIIKKDRPDRLTELH